MLPTVAENNKKHNNFSETTVTLGNKEHHVIVGNAGVSMNDIKTVIAESIRRTGGGGEEKEEAPKHNIDNIMKAALSYRNQPLNNLSTTAALPAISIEQQQKEAKEIQDAIEAEKKEKAAVPTTTPTSQQQTQIQQQQALSKYIQQQQQRQQQRQQKYQQRQQQLQQQQISTPLLSSSNSNNIFNETTVTLGDKEHHVIVGNAGVSMNDIKTKIAKTNYLYSKNMASITTVVPKPNEIIKISNMSKIPLKGPPAPVPVPFHVNNPVYNKPNVPILMALPKPYIPNVPISMVLPKPTNRNYTRKKSLLKLSKYGLRPRAKKIITTPETRNYYEIPNYKQAAAEIAARVAARGAAARAAKAAAPDAAAPDAAAPDAAYKRRADEIAARVAARGAAAREAAKAAALAKTNTQT